MDCSQISNQLRVKKTSRLSSGTKTDQKKVPHCPTFDFFRVPKSAA